ncbi:MAG: DinB family protein [Gemmatales bacterium]|nr:DinB family protein [Gemmatales bacterium]
MASREMLKELARQVRGRTRDILAAARTEWLTWAPEGTSNHILWHAGHAVWLLDVLGIELLTGKSELPAGWAETFGMRCRPPRLTTDWPSREQVDRLLAEQLRRFCQLLEGTPEERFTIPPDPHKARYCLAGQILHGLHDEACHSGEMYLLLKMCRAQFG